MWKEKLKEIEKQEALYEEKINEGATKVELNIFIKNAKKKLSVVLPDEYIDILSIVNGLEFNGHIVYGIDEELLTKDSNQDIIGFIDLNETWYENNDLKKYLFLGESDMSWFVYEISTQKYRELDKPSGSELYEYASLTDMVDKILTHSLI